jgi:hypothetical protein
MVFGHLGILESRTAPRGVNSPISVSLSSTDGVRAEREPLGRLGELCGNRP